MNRKITLIEEALIIILFVNFICTFLFLSYLSPVFAEKILDYGFEDWTGSANTTPGYISSTGYASYWDTHLANTEIVSSGDKNCELRDAYEGNYYFHQNFFDGEVDSCLGTIPLGINPHTNIGSNLQYPLDPKNNLNLEDVVGSKMTIRFYFRTTGNWPNAVTNFMKFIRVYGAGVTSSILHITDDSSQFDITDHPQPDEDNTWANYHNIFSPLINWNDGQWHAVTETIEILNSSYPNIRVNVWWDDWDMEGAPDGLADVYQPGYGNKFNHISLFVNWGNTYPDSDMGIDLDKLEIWDGLPGVIDTTPPTISNPQPTTTLPMGTTQTNISITTNENATCKYSTTLNTDYNSMTNTFTTTGTTTHSQTITNLTDTNTYNYYIRCQDTSNNSNNTDTTITFSIANQTIRSDTNQDQIINTTDALLTLRNSLGLDMTSTSWQNSTTTGDTDCDNISNSTDAMLILRYSLGLSMSGTLWCE